MKWWINSTQKKRLKERHKWVLNYTLKCITCTCIIHSFQSLDHFLATCKLYLSLECVIAFSHCCAIFPEEGMVRRWGSKRKGSKAQWESTVYTQVRFSFYYKGETGLLYIGLFLSHDFFLAIFTLANYFALS